MNGDITEFTTLKEEAGIDEENKRYYCLIKIRANVKKTTNTLDASFDFNVKLNQKNFRDGEELKIDINVNKPIYLTIYQWLPYEEKDYAVYKIFPNSRETNNYIKQTHEFYN